MRTGQVAAEAGVNTETLRYYERRGLLQEPPRRDSGYRAYSVDTVATVRFIKEAQKLGFTLSEVEILLHLDRGGPADCEAARALATEKLLDLESRVASLTAMHHSLEQLVATCEQPLGNRECPLIVALAGLAEDKKAAPAAVAASKAVTGRGEGEGHDHAD
jgi:Hg(II)-responsive transcriptional regulator